MRQARPRTASAADVTAALRFGHDQIRAGFVRVSYERGRVAHEALALARVCLPHFEREEEVLLPVLGVLRGFVCGEFRSEMAAIRPAIAAFREWRDYLDRQHDAVALALESFLYAAQKARNAEAVEVAYALKAHEWMETEAIYPAAALVAAYANERAGYAAPAKGKPHYKPGTVH
jgi:hypothetical protein